MLCEAIENTLNLYPFISKLFCSPNSHFHSLSVISWLHQLKELHNYFEQNQLSF